MRGQRFYTEDFRGVMPAEQKIHAELFSGNSGPVRSFASDKGVDAFLCDPINVRACATSHNADRASLFWAEIENFYRTVQCFSQFTSELTARHRLARLQADRLAFFFEKRLRRPDFVGRFCETPGFGVWHRRPTILLGRFESKRGDELRVITNLRMD